MIMVVFPCGPFLQASVKIKNTWKGGGEGSKPVSKCVFKESPIYHFHSLIWTAIPKVRNLPKVLKCYDHIIYVNFELIFSLNY